MSAYLVDPLSANRSLESRPSETRRARDECPRVSRVSDTTPSRAANMRADGLIDSISDDDSMIRRHVSFRSRGSSHIHP